MYKRIFTIKLSDLSSSRPWGVGGGGGGSGGMLQRQGIGPNTK